MKNKLNDLEKRQSIRNLVKFLEQNKQTITEYGNLEHFRQSMDNLYVSIKDASYDSIEFDVPENIDVRESKSYYYYSINMVGNQIISIINKNLKEFYFLNIVDNVNYEIVQYLKNGDNKMSMSKKDKCFRTIRDAKAYKSLILKPIIDNYF